MKKMISICLVSLFLLIMVSCTTQNSYHEAEILSDGTVVLPICPEEDSERYRLFRGKWYLEDSDSVLKLPRRQPSDSEFILSEDGASLTLLVNSGEYYGSYTIFQMDETYAHHWVVLLYFDSVEIEEDSANRITEASIPQDLIDKAVSGEALTEEEIYILRGGIFDSSENDTKTFLEYWKDETAMDRSDLYMPEEEEKTGFYDSKQASCQDLYSRCSQLDYYMNRNLDRYLKALQMAVETGYDYSMDEYDLYKGKVEAWEALNYQEYDDRIELENLIFDAQTLNEELKARANEVAAELGIHSIDEYTYN